MFQGEAKRAFILNSRLLYIIAPAVRRHLDSLGCRQCDRDCPIGRRTLYAGLQGRLHGLLSAHEGHPLGSFNC